MAIRVEWLNDDHTILGLTVRDGLNLQEARRLLQEWIRPMIANTQKSVAFVADFRESNLFAADADLLIRRMMQLLCDSVHAKAIVVVGVNTSFPNTAIIPAKSVAEAIEYLSNLLTS
jgi:hypothetical protein